MGGKPRQQGHPVQMPHKERAKLIEQFRRVGIRLDRTGQFWHLGEPITHVRLVRALRKWLDVRPEDGRPILRLDDERYAYVDVDDALLLIESVTWNGDVAMATLNDESREELACDTLKVGPGFALYALARDRRLLARLTPRAYYSLAERIEDSPTGFVVNARGGPYAIGELGPRIRRFPPGL